MLKKMKLASRLAMVIGIVLTVIFTILIIITITMSSSAIAKATYGELNAISNSNSRQIQEIFDSARTVASNMVSYLERAYKNAEEDKELSVMPTDPAAIALCRSNIYDKTLTPLNYDVEVYLSENARNCTLYNDDIEGVGVMFEPYKFQYDMRDYSFYVDESSANDDIASYGTYDTYSQEADYKQAVSSMKDVVTEPYEADGMTLVSYATPITYNNEVMGVAMADIDMASFSKVDSTNEKYPSMYATIYNDAGTIVYDSEDPEDVGKTLVNFTPDKSELAYMQNSMSGNTAFTVETTREDGRKIMRFFTPIEVASHTWWALVAVDSKEINAAVVSTTVWMSVLSVAALIVIIFTVIVLLKKMLSPVNEIVAAAENIAVGNLDIQFSEYESEDEIGVLKKSFQSMSDMLKAMVSDVQYLLGEMAVGNFDIKTRSEEVYIGNFKEFLLSMRKLNHMLSSTLSQINQSADQVSAGSEQVSAGAQALSQGATEQASSIEELAATINEISEQIYDTANNASEARMQTSKTGEEVASSNSQMQEMMEAMAEIEDKSNQIGKIIKTIEDIAFQTNILALNAAVEAARAGTAGKGFAVVADEVRNLAGKSAEASKNTAELIEGAVNAVEKGRHIANETAQSLSKVVESTESVSSIVDKIAEAAEEQSGSVGQVTQGIDQISSVVQTNSATSEESAAASEELSSQAAMLKELVGQFKLRK